MKSPMHFDPEMIIEQLEKNASIFVQLLDADIRQIKHKPVPEKWNMLEIACHLLDEETEDFRARLRHVLDQNPDPMASIDPPLWVTERNYSSQDIIEVLNNFRLERDASVVWLRSLQNTNWDLFYEHPKLGKMTAKLFLSNWLAHDYLHMRQILGLRFAFLSQMSGEDLSYAGTW